MSEPRDEEEGYTPIPHQLMNVLSQVNLGAHETRVLWFVLRKTYGWHKHSDTIPLQQISEATGLPKPHCSQAVNRLVRREILHKDRYRQIGISENYKNSLHDDVRELHQDATSLRDNETQLHDDVRELHQDATLLHSNETELHDDVTEQDEGVHRDVTKGSPSCNPSVPEGVHRDVTSKDKYKNTYQKYMTPPDGGDTSVDASSRSPPFTEWKTYIINSKNKQAKFVEMLQAMLPYWSPPKNAIARMGRIVKKHNYDYGYLALRIWQMSAKPPAGDPLNYLEGTNETRQDQDRKRGYRTPKRRPSGDDLL